MVLCEMLKNSYKIVIVARERTTFGGFRAIGEGASPTDAAFGETAASPTCERSMPVPYLIPVSVTRKHAVALDPAPVIVCGNSDYRICLSFDEEWDAEPEKTVRFVWQSGGQPVYADVLTSDGFADVPVLFGTPEVAVGVFAGALRTTTPARIMCIPCIRDGAPVHADPPQDVYDQLLARLNEIEAGSPPPAAFAVPVLFGASGIGGAGEED